MTSVTFDKIHKSFGRNHVLRDFDLSVADREFVVIVGPSGCGKSTTLRLLAGLETPDSGTISIDGQPVDGMTPRARDIAMVFQDYALYPHKTVRENLGFGLRVRRVPRAEAEARIHEAARILGLEALLDRRPAQLSGGQRQRVAMGRAITRRPRAFLFDEPLSNLDAQLRSEVRAEIKRLHRQLDATILYVTHDQVEAMTLADRIVILNAGQIEQIGTPEQIYHRPDNAFVAGFIGTPPMNFLDGEIVDGRIAFGQTFAPPDLIPQSAQPGGVRIGRKLRIGIRPEDLRPAGLDSDRDNAEAIPLAGRVLLVEPLGADTLVHLDCAGASLIARLSPDHRPQPGQLLQMKLDPNRLFLFDGDTLRALR